MPQPTTSQNMTKIIMALTLTLLLLPLTSFILYAQSGYPESIDSYINDYANLLNSQDRTNIQTLLMDLKAQHGIEATILTIGSINDYSTGDATLEAFATNLFNTWWRQVLWRRSQR